MPHRQTFDLSGPITASRFSLLTTGPACVAPAVHECRRGCAAHGHPGSGSMPHGLVFDLQKQAARLPLLTAHTDASQCDSRCARMSSEHSRTQAFASRIYAALLSLSSAGVSSRLFFSSVIQIPVSATPAVHEHQVSIAPHSSWVQDLCCTDESLVLQKQAARLPLLAAHINHSQCDSRCAQTSSEHRAAFESYPGSMQHC